MLRRIFISVLIIFPIFLIVAFGEQLVEIPFKSKEWSPPTDTSKAIHIALLILLAVVSGFLAWTISRRRLIWAWVVAIWLFGSFSFVGMTGISESGSFAYGEFIKKQENDLTRDCIDLASLKVSTKEKARLETEVVVEVFSDAMGKGEAGSTYYISDMSEGMWDRAPKRGLPSRVIQDLRAKYSSNGITFSEGDYIFQPHVESSNRTLTLDRWCWHGKDDVLVKVGKHCGWLCGDWHFLRLRKSENSWQIYWRKKWGEL